MRMSTSADWWNFKQRQHKRHSFSKLYPEGLPLLQSSCLAINKSASHTLLRTHVSFDVMHNAEVSCWSHKSSGMSSTMLKLASTFQPTKAKPKTERLRTKNWDQSWPLVHLLGILFPHVYGCLACMSVYHVHAGPTEDRESSGTGVTS